MGKENQVHFRIDDEVLARVQEFERVVKTLTRIKVTRSAVLTELIIAGLELCEREKGITSPKMKTVLDADALR